MKPLILYHANCTDGFGAAFSAWCKFGDAAEYVPMHYGNPLPPVDGRDVYVLDFSFPRQETELLCTDTSSFTWLDHHKTAFEMWCTDGERTLYCEDDTQPGHNVFILLDNNKSGAMLAWEHFHPDKDVPDLIRYIDDRDRWVFQYDNSKALHAGLQLRQPWTFRNWAYLVPAMGGTSVELGKVVDDGRTALQVIDEQVRHCAKKAARCTIRHPHGGDDSWVFAPGLAVNSPLNASEVGHALANASGTYGLVWYYKGDNGRAYCSLRSNGDYDVSAIAKAFGGGGHKNAAGFEIDMPTLLEWLR